jgi:transposase
MADKKAKRRRAQKGHGRNGALAYTGAQRVKVAHPTLFKGAPCPQDYCEDGKMYRFFEPKTLVRIEGTAPLSACIYELEQWRCHLCGTLVAAPMPPGAGEEKYKATAVANLGLMRFCVCMPGSRLEMLQNGYGVPVAASTQWELLKRKTPVMSAVHEALMDIAARAPFLFNDDTGARILEMTPKERAELLGPGADPKRTGVFTTGIIAKDGEREIALYFTGPRYAGENLTELLKRRSPDLPAPVLMCDGLTTRNLPRNAPVILSQCNVHSRRNFIHVQNSFPEARFVLETLASVYAVDEAARRHNLSDEARLKLHQDESGPHMSALKAWMDAQFDEKLVEPNSGLGKAITYAAERWTELNRFLEIAGASLDSNVVEQILRRVAHFRNGSLYYRTLEGAKVGDTWMSVIRTAEKAGVNVFDYLVALLEHPNEVAANPKAWLPWTYVETLADLEAAAGKAARAA